MRYCEFPPGHGISRHENIQIHCRCGQTYCMNCWNKCPKCDHVTIHHTVPDGTLTAIRAIAAHVTDSRLAMAAIRVLLDEK